MSIENKNIFREINFIYHIELKKNVSEKIAKIVTSFFLGEEPICLKAQI